MRKRLMFVVTALLLVTSSLHGQSASLKSYIPFDFFVGNTLLPAGAYTIKPVGVGGSSELIRSADLKHAVFITPSTYALDRTDHDSRLIFKLVGGRYFLWQIWTQLNDLGRELSVRPPEAQEEILAQSSTVAIKAATISRP